MANSWYKWQSDQMVHLQCILYHITENIKTLKTFIVSGLLFSFTKLKVSDQIFKFKIYSEWFSSIGFVKLSQVPLI